MSIPPEPRAATASDTPSDSAIPDVSSKIASTSNTKVPITDSNDTKAIIANMTKDDVHNSVLRSNAETKPQSETQPHLEDIATKILTNDAPSQTAQPMPQVSTAISNSSADDEDPAAVDFKGDIETDNVLPTQEILRKIQDYQVLDEHGKCRSFKSLYTGPNVARRVLVIFIRHFFCGQCQEYLRTVSLSITPSSLLKLPVPTFIAIIGCGSPSLIPMYRQTTSCPFPIYADPGRRLYEELGMTKTFALGKKRPEYARKGLVSIFAGSIVQELKGLVNGKALKGGDYRQVGGEFLFEPIRDISSSPLPPPSPADGQFATPNGEGDSYFEEEKKVSWCHRMRNTRDHAEIPELREVLGLSGEGRPGKNEKRWTRAKGERKGTGLSGMARDENGEEDLSHGNPEPIIVEGH